MAKNKLDLSGEICPFTFVKTKLVLDGLSEGELLEVILDDEAALRDVPRTVGSEGHTVVSVEEVEKGKWKLVIKKGGSS